MWKYRLLYLAAIAASLIVFLVADRREPLVLLCILALAPLVSAGIQRAAMRSLSVYFQVRESCRLGQKVPVTFTVRRKSRLPLGVIRINVKFINLLFKEEEGQEICLQPGESREMVFQYLFEARDCGAVRIQAGNADCYDMLGLFRWSNTAAPEQQVTVYPPELQLNVDLSRRPETIDSGELYDQNRKGQDVSEVSDLRDYIPGDALHSVHWKLSGKMDRLIIREFGHPSNYNTLLLYEVMKKAGGREISHQCNNAVLSLAGALSYSMMQMNLEHNVGRIHMGEIRAVPVHSLETHEQMVLNMLSLPVLEEESSLNTVYLFLRGNLRSEFTKIIYITPVFSDQAIRQLSEEVDLTVIQVAEEKKAGYTASAGYTVIPVNAGTYQDNVQNIII